jgi:hypothetical protein
VKSVGFLVISVPVLPVRSTGHLGSTQPGAGEGLAVVDEALVEDTMVDDSTIVEAGDD